MKATLIDVCRKAGVSTATVSRVLNESPLVTEHTKKRVLKAMRELDYHPSYAAQTLARQRTDVVGVVFPAIDSGFYVEVLKGIDEAAARRGYHLMTAIAHSPRQEEDLILHFIRGRRVDAVVLMNVNVHDKLLARIGSQKIPLVLIGKPSPIPELFSVAQDNRKGAGEAFAHLLSHGYRNIVLMAGPKDSYDSEQRLEGCREVARRHGLSIGKQDILRGAFTYAGGRKAMEQWLREKRALPEALFAFNDAMALGVLTALREVGHRIPDDMALVGYDDCETARFIGLTSVRAPMPEMGRIAADKAIGRALEEPSPDESSLLLPAELVVRESCGSHHNGLLPKPPRPREGLLRDEGKAIRRGDAPAHRREG